MGTRYKTLTKYDIDFIKKQKLFYLASSSGKEVNLSPKGYDSIRILDDKTLLYLDFPGSGNRTYRDTVKKGEFTLVFNAFEGEAYILRIFCESRIIDKKNILFKEYMKYFTVKSEYIRQIFVFDIYTVENSCGMSVPYMNYEKERKDLKDWAKVMADKGDLEDYILKYENPEILTRG